MLAPAQTYASFEGTTGGCRPHGAPRQVGLSAVCAGLGGAAATHSPSAGNQLNVPIRMGRQTLPDALA